MSHNDSESHAVILYGMTRTGVDQLLYLMDQAFEQGDGQHGLLKNLQDVRDDDWARAAPGGARSIAEITQHLGDCKRMYANHAFDDAKMSWHEFDARWKSLPAKADDRMAARRPGLSPRLRGSADRRWPDRIPQGKLGHDARDPLANIHNDRA